jgi:hypothetical protein
VIDAGTPSACDSGAFTAPSLSEGPHTFSVFATDAVGNADTSPATREFTIDTVAPSAEITKQPKAIIKSRRRKVPVSFAFQSNEGGAFKCSLDAAPAQDCTSPETYKVQRGVHTFSVTAVDAAGNESDPDTYAFRVKRKR